MGRTTSQEAISCHQSQEPGLVSGDREEGRGGGQRDLSQWGDGQGSDTCMEERKREQSKLVDPFVPG